MGPHSHQQCPGSSPRTWGTLFHALFSSAPGRFIPTHVGNTDGTVLESRGCSVHPHARGEHLTVAGSPRTLVGSSPRTWGTLLKNMQVSNKTRFIPTHVGNTILQRILGRQVAVHPHARGEHCGPAGRRWTHVGSSPRTWGTHLEREMNKHPSRFIPTHVGNTSACRTILSPRTVHPHARGEHIAKVSSIIQKVGSSPRTWGTRTYPSSQ